MINNFLDDNFLLNTDTARQLYHQVAEHMPIIDYHCHLSPQDIYEDKTYRSITEMWLGSDHYKWRLLRANGIDERYITGDATDEEKFEKWAQTVPEMIGNPIYHWTHLELRRYFGVKECLNGDNWKRIYNICNQQLDKLTARKIISLSNVKVICTTDDPLDDLHFHQLLDTDKSFETRVFPSFRPDQAINVDMPSFFPWLHKLSQIAHPIADLDDFKRALVKRIDFFHEHHCRLSDHGLSSFPFMNESDQEVYDLFNKVITDQPLNDCEIAKIKSHLLVFLGREYAKRDWTQQYHFKPMRNINKKMYKLLGSDAGYDAIDDSSIAGTVAKLLNVLEESSELPKTIIYSLDERDYQALASIGYCFQSGPTTGKIQLGSAWWFNDHLSGMSHQMDILANYGLLSKFIGMLTDSRSFLSYTRHEYFRRLLCDKIGTIVENGEYPNDIKFLEKLIQDICYQNAVSYLRFPNFN